MHDLREAARRTAEADKMPVVDTTYGLVVAGSHRRRAADEFR
jgi:hypothetical protein